MKRLFLSVLSLLAGCATSPPWQQSYPAPYNSAASEEEARIWKKTDDAFKDRTDYLVQGKFEEERVYPKAISQAAPVLTPELKKERGVVLAVAEGDVVVMKPFVIEEMKDWIGLTLVHDPSGKITKVEVGSVAPNKPYSLAGIEKGMSVKSLNGLNVAGMSKVDVEHAFMEFITRQQDFRMEVAVSGKKSREIVIPLEQFRRRESTNMSTEVP